MEKIKNMKELLSKASELIEAEDISLDDIKTEENQCDGCIIISISDGDFRLLSLGHYVTLAIGIGQLLVRRPKVCSTVLRYIMEH